MDREDLRERIDELPREPGVYQFFDGETALYIGKAVDLRSRVPNYLDPRSPRIEAMVDRADRLEVAITDTETQALLLEANLIKRHQPRYNVRLTDDKSFPVVQITDHHAPRIEVTRDPEPDATVFGPFTDRQRLDAVVKAIREHTGMRGCSDHKYANRDRPCLDYEIGLCAAPCTGEVDPDTYAAGVGEAVRFFEGEIGLLARPIREAMDEAASEQAFERAAHLRDRLEAIERLHGHGEPAISAARDEHTVDVIGVAIAGDEATVARLHSDGGQLVDRDQRSLSAPVMDADKVATVIAAFVPQYYAERPLPDAIIVPELPDDREIRQWLAAEEVDIRVPQDGRERTLLELALKNANRARDATVDPLAQLADRLGIDRPTRIEGIDVSHAHGRDVVGSNVVFVDASPTSGAYRRKKLEEGNDDVDRMRELARWRATRAMEGRDDRPDPDLFLVDGGTAQRNAVVETFATIGWEVPVIGLAKREETVITDHGPEQWAADDPGLHLLQRVRDEAHRFAVSYHQTIRDSVETVLDDMPGIGPTRRRRLLRRFGSLEGIRTASIEELTSVEGIGEETASAIAERF